MSWVGTRSISVKAICQHARFVTYRFNRSIAAEAVTFFAGSLFFLGAQEGFAVWRDPKVTKRSSRKKPSAHGQNSSEGVLRTGRVFRQAFTRFYY